MNGAAITPAQLAAVARNDLGAVPPIPASAVNAFRVSAVVDRLSMHVRTGQKNDANEFFNLCLSLARGIDYAVANNEIPSIAQDLPLLIKQVCLRKNNFFLHAAIMVLMVSVKNACKIGWFSARDTGELFILANEIWSGFCSPGDINVEPSSCLPTISNVMCRFFPRMKMGQILASLEVKPGYGAFVVDFHISKNTKSSPQEKIRLFVAQTDNMETSSCIITPPQVNFLLNGKGVERRINVSMDSGPQIPTNVTAMLKYGTNLLQTVGHFNGNYIIVVAFMTVMQSPDRPVLPDYVQPVASTLNKDSEIIEGPSRISLNCPISYTRIKAPVKGHLCKHLQCFDFDNYVEINLRRPYWRCPHCNQYVCYTDIRIDQNMVKVLREVGESVADVIISADGSWKAILESCEHKDQPKDPPHDKPLSCSQEGSKHPEFTSFSNALPNVLDLTAGDDEMDSGTFEMEERKPCHTNIQSHSIVTNPPVLSELNNASVVNQNNAQAANDYQTGVLFSAYGPATSGARAGAQIVGGFSGPSSANTRLSPVLTDAISPSFNREPENFLGASHLTNSSLLSQLPAADNLPLQQSQFGHSLTSNNFGRLPALPRVVSRNPIAVQALPVQSPSPGLQERSRATLNSLIPNGSSIAPQDSPSMLPFTDDSNNLVTDVERQQSSRSLVNPLQVSDMASPSLQHQLTAQNWNRRDCSFISGRSVQQVLSPSPPSQLPGAFRVSSGLPTERQNSNLQQPLNRMAPQTRSQAPSLVRSNALLPRTNIQQGGSQGGVGRPAGSGNNSLVQNARYIAAANRTALQAVQLGRQSQSVPFEIQAARAHPSHVNTDSFRASVGEQRRNMGGTMHSVSGADGLMDLPSEHNWRPTGRMRGSLTGQALSAAMSQFMIQPTQPSQAAQVARPPPNLVSPSSGSAPSQMHMLISRQPSSLGSGLGNLPERSLGM